MLAAQRVADRGLECIRQGDDLVVGALDARAGEDCDLVRLIQEGCGLVDIPPGLSVDDGAFQLSPSFPAQRGRGCLRDEKPLVLPGGDRQEVELGGPVEDGTHQVFRSQHNAGFFKNLTHGCGARVFPLFDAATDREPPEPLRLIFVVALGQ